MFYQNLINYGNINMKKYILITMLFLVNICAYSSYVKWDIRKSSGDPNKDIEKVKYQVVARVIESDMSGIFEIAGEIEPFSPFGSSHNSEKNYEENYKLKLEQDFFNSNKKVKEYEAQLSKNGKIVSKKRFKLKAITRIVLED